MKNKFAIQTNQLTKKFENSGWHPWQSDRHAKAALIDITFEISWGEMVALMGPNGAGKTTLVKILSTLITPSSGSAQVAGYPLSAGSHIRKEIGLVLTDERSFYWRLTGRQNLVFFAALHQMYGSAAQSRIDQLLRVVDLEESADLRFDRYSSGMKQRLSIARGLIHAPKLLFLDEPTRSLDQSQKERLHHLLTDLNQNFDQTIVLITHDPQEAVSLCHRTLHLAAGKIVSM